MDCQVVKFPLVQLVRLVQLGCGWCNSEELNCMKKCILTKAYKERIEVWFKKNERLPRERI